MGLAKTCVSTGMLVHSLDGGNDVGDLKGLATVHVDSLKVASVMGRKQVSELSGVVDFRHENDSLTLHERSNLVIGQRPELARRESVDLYALLGQTVHG